MKRVVTVVGACLPVWSVSCEDGKRSPNPCEQFNTVYYKMDRNNRANSCMKEKGCKFIGAGWKGSCVPVHTVTAKRPDDNEMREYSLLLSQESNSPAVAIEILMKKQITSSVADSIIESHEAMHEVSKELVIDVLNDQDNVGKLATVLGNVFQDESVLAPIRSFAYYYLHVEPTMINIDWLLHQQMRYFFREHGKTDTEYQLISLFIWWSKQEHFRQALYPLVTWAITDEETSVKPLATIAVEALNYREKMAGEALASYVCSYLDSEETKTIVKEQISNALLKRFSRKLDLSEQNVEPPASTIEVTNQGVVSTPNVLEIKSVETSSYISSSATGPSSLDDRGISDQSSSEDSGGSGSGSGTSNAIRSHVAAAVAEDEDDDDSNDPFLETVWDDEKNP